MIYIVLIMIIVFSFLKEDIANLLSFLPFITMSCIMATFSFDDLSNWNAYSSVFPNGRQNCVKARYISSIITLFSNLFLVIFSSFIIKIFGGNINIITTITTSLAIIILSLFVILIMFPLIYKYSPHKAGIIFMIIMLSFTSIISIIPTNISAVLFNPIIDLFINHLFILTTISIILFTYISYKISKKIYLKDDF